MDEILANETKALLMILLQEKSPILTVRILRAVICFGAVLSAALAATFSTSWVLRQVLNMWQ